MSVRRPDGIPFLAKLGVAVVAIAVVLVVLSSVFGYAFYQVSSTQVAIQFMAGQPIGVVGPGVYTDLRPFADIRTINVAGLPFEVADKEVLTKDEQRIGVTVTGTVHRPGLDKSDQIIRNWSQYSIFYTDDAALVGTKSTDPEKPGTSGVMTALGQQAEKVCVGDLNFDEAVIGSARDVLRECINQELDNLAAGYGLEVNNIVVPNIVMSAEVQKQLDDITAARFNTQLAQQRGEQAKAEADRDLQTQQGAIRVEQGKIQEKAKQDAITAELNKKALEAQAEVIQQQKANELLTTQKDLEIQTTQAKVAEQEANAKLAETRVQAQIYQGAPEYVKLKQIEYMSAAWKNTDKVIIPAGTDPYIFIGGTPGNVTVPAATPTPSP